jgi:hypothetical protein
MNDGTGAHTTPYSARHGAGCLHHNLSLTEQCFKHLLEVLNDGGTEPGEHPPDAGVDRDSLSRLCANNIELLSRIHELIGGYRDIPAVAARGENRAEPGQLQDRRFRERLVDLMVTAVHCWEQWTGTSRIELAEQSGIWRINVDEGRLRVRAMDRYLGIGKLPMKPRWRDVVNTAYFVLDHVEGDRPIRTKLEGLLEETLSLVREQAL